LDTKMTDVEAGVSALDTKMTDVEAGVSALDTKMTDVEAGVSALDTKMTDVEAGVSALDTKMTDVEAGVSALDTKMTDVEAGVSALDTKMTDVESSVATLDTKVADVEAGVAVLATKMTDVEAGVSALDTKVADVEADVAVLDTKMTDVEAGVSALDTKVADVEADVAVLNTEMTNVEASVSTLDTKMADVEAGVAVLDTKMTNVETGVAALDTKMADVEAGVAVLNTEMTNVEAGVSALDTKMTDVESSVSALDTQYVDLNARITALETVPEPEWITQLMSEQIDVKYCVSKGMITVLYSGALNTDSSSIVVSAIEPTCAFGEFTPCGNACVNSSPAVVKPNPMTSFEFTLSGLSEGDNEVSGHFICEWLSLDDIPRDTSGDAVFVIDTRNTIGTGQSYTELTIPLTGLTGTIDWGDGTQTESTPETFISVRQHFYAVAGIYEVHVWGAEIGDWTFSVFRANAKLIELKQWGGLKFGRGASFANAVNMCITATDSAENLYLHQTDLRSTFRYCESLDGIPGIENWDVSNVISMESMFEGCKKFRADLSQWNVSNNTTMLKMFANCWEFNSDLSQWNVSKVTTLQSAFYSAKLFRSDLFTNNIFYHHIIGHYNSKINHVASYKYRSC